MIGHPQPRRTPARPNLLSQRPAPIPLLALLFALVLVASLVIMAAGCGSKTTTTSAATATSATTAPAGDTSTTAAPAGDTTTTAASAGSDTTVASTPAEEGTFPVTLKDDNGNSVTIKAKPMRIVSTAPASTEILFALGVGDRVVGVSSLDDYPAEAAKIAKVGDFQANTEAIMALSPDLVLGYSGNEEALAPVQKAGSPVMIFNPTTLEQIYADITMVGQATGATGKADEVIAGIKAQVGQITAEAAKNSFSPKVFYALDNTLWTAGPGSFVDQLLKLVGATNVGSVSGGGNAATQAYYQFSAEQLVASDPDIVLLPNTAYKSVDEFTGDPRFAQLTAVKDKHVYLINDVIITRPGSRVGEGLKTLFDAIKAGTE
jgi:iron complex transport system substrate-binding protein